MNLMKNPFYQYININEFNENPFYQNINTNEFNEKSFLPIY